MTRRRHHPAGSPPSPAPASATDAEPSPQAWGWGQAVALVWYLGGFLALLVGAVMQVGPSAWAAAWQVRHLGSDSMTLGFVPGYALLLLPLVILRCLPRRPDRPFLCGLQDALWPKQPVHRTTLPREAELARLRRVRGVMVGLALACVVAAAVPGWLSLRLGDQRPGTPLPVLTLAEATLPGAVLPGYARLVGALPRPEAAWSHDYTIRAARYQDTYTPLTAPDWRPGDPVAALQVDRRDLLGLPGPEEGALSRGLPGWLMDVLRETGLPLVNAPLVLTRDTLHGTVPEPDGVGALVAAMFGGTTCLTFSAIAIGFHRAYRRLLARGAGA